MKYQIKNRSDEVIFEGEAESFKALIEAAVKEGANLYGANLSDTKGLFQIVPEKGSFHGFKKLANGVVAELQIPADAARVGGWTDRKCRAEYAIVIEGKGVSKFDKNFVYTKGATVRPLENNPWNPDAREVCSGGIHFFLTRQEAEDY